MSPSKLWSRGAVEGEFYGIVRGAALGLSVKDLWVQEALRQNGSRLRETAFTAGCCKCQLDAERGDRRPSRLQHLLSCLLDGMMDVVDTSAVGCEYPRSALREGETDMNRETDMKRVRDRHEKRERHEKRDR